MDAPLLLMSLTASLLALAQTRITDFCIFHSLSYLGLLAVSLWHSVRGPEAQGELLPLALLSMCYLAVEIALLARISRRCGGEVQGLRGFVNTSPEESWLLIVMLIACSSLPPFAPFFWLERVGLALAESLERTILAATRYMWLVVNARMMITVLDTGGKIRVARLSRFAALGTILVTVLLLATLLVAFGGVGV